MYTSHCDPKHCFEEARDGTLKGWRVLAAARFLCTDVLILT